LILIHADLIDQDFLLFSVLVACTLFALLVGVGLHEACHAYTATALGDTLPRRQGRVTLNPLAHLDPAGTVMMALIGFGWGKPVQFNPYGLRMKPKTASFLVALAGPMSNIVIAALLAIPIKAGWAPYINPLTNAPAFFFDAQVETRQEYLGLFLTGAVYLNCILGVFNLIPIPPLDGFKVALGVLPDDMAHEFAKLDRYGFGILMLLIFVIPFLTGYSVLRDIMGPAVEWMVHLFTGV
jgi:Zn-dependent protease